MVASDCCPLVIPNRSSMVANCSHERLHLVRLALESNTLELVGYAIHLQCQRLKRYCCRHWHCWLCCCCCCCSWCCGWHCWCYCCYYGLNSHFSSCDPFHHHSICYPLACVSVFEWCLFSLQSDD